MSIPEQFTAEWIASHSPPEVQLYREFLRSGEPYRSMLAANPWLQPPEPGKPLEWGTGRYWDTTVGRLHEHWRDVALPHPEQDIRVLRRDLAEWGYCLVRDGLSPEQCRVFAERLFEQAAGERAAGIAYQTPSGQYVNTLINKGAVFVGCIEHDPAWVQAGPLIEQLLDETLGKGWTTHSFLANGADPGGYPQGLHFDQGPLSPHITTEAPALVNTMFIPQDVDHTNGSTLLIPGSHRALIEAGSGGEVGALPPAIHLEAPAGTLLVFDGRLLHGTGANRSDQRRFVATQSSVTSWMRQQENWALSVAPDVLAGASERLKHRMGLQALTHGATVEGFGLGGRGHAGDAWGDISLVRAAYDTGGYERVRELGADGAPKSGAAPDVYTIPEAIRAARSRR